jgi:hypothetical protein
MVQPVIFCLAYIWTLMFGLKTGYAASADDNLTRVRLFA